MLQKKAVFFIGAGASAEAGLPVGTQLKKQISEMLGFEVELGERLSDNGDNLIYKLIYHYFSNDLDTYFGACRQISRGLIHASSIDDFIHNFKGNKAIATCGKIAIVKAILDAEYDSNLFFHKTNLDSTINFDEVENTWYAAFYNLLTQGVPRDDLATVFENLTIVCFNYDRCIEHYLVHALINHYSLMYAEAITLVERISIYRPYGSVGNYFDRANTYPFGSRTFPSLEAITSSLRTYTERTHTPSESESMLDAISEAKMLVFLGMAFHPNNMQLLYDNRANFQSVPKEIYATRYAVSDASMPMVYEKINRICYSNLGDRRQNSIEHLSTFQTCAALFEEYGTPMRS